MNEPRNLNIHDAQIKQLKAGFQKPDAVPQKIFIPDRNGYIGIEISKIVYIEGVGSYAKIVTDDEELLVSKNVKYIEDILKEHTHFLRVHRSFVINMRKVEIIVKGTPAQLVLSSGIKVPVSKNSWDEVLYTLGVI